MAEKSYQIKIGSTVTLGFLIIVLSLLSSKENKKIAEYTKILKKDSNNAEAFYQRGYAYFNKKDYAKAIEDFTSAIKINPELTKAYLCRGCAFIETEDYEKAVSDMNRVQEGETRNEILFLVYTYRGFAYKKLGNFDSSVTEYKKAFEIDPKYVEIDIHKARAKAISLFN
jgi:tetratricopeptide (TPR) repeat protein